MSEKTKRTLGTASLLMGFAVVYVILLLTAVHAAGTDDALYFSEQMKADVLPASGISRETLKRLDGTLAAWLGGDEGALEEEDGAPIRAEIFGALRSAFNDRETTHLRDCFELFKLLRRIRSRLVPWAILLTLSGAWLLQDRRRIRLCAWLSPLIVILPLGGFSAWACADFDGAFIFFHKVLFRNDLWLLDPAEDLLIRICPESMFMHMGIRIAVFAPAAILAVSAAATLMTFVWPKRLSTPSCGCCRPGKRSVFLIVPIRQKGDNSWNRRDMRRASAPKRITFGKTDMR